MSSFSKLEWMDAVRQCADIPAEQRLIIQDIGSTADRFGSDAWRDNKSVARRLKVSERTVTRARENAVKHRLWVETRPADNKHTARYSLTFPASWDDSGVHPDRGGVTRESDWVDTAVSLGGQRCPVGVTAVSTASGFSSGSSSDSSSDAGYGDNAHTRDGVGLWAAFSANLKTDLQGETDPWSGGE